MILAIGDSNMYPACTEVLDSPNVNNMVAVFSSNLDQTFKCWSKNGASNHWIETHIEYFLADHSWPTDTLLLVGWTSPEREEWPWLYNNISVCGGPDFGVPAAIKARYQQWKQTLTEEYLQSRMKMWHDRIYSCHLRLRTKSVPHLFWTTYDNFKSMQDRREWHGNFFQPYDLDGCMCRFLQAQNIKSLHDDPFHYDDHAHRVWATALSDHARKFIL